MHEPLARYLESFRTLHRNRNRAKGAAPHKPILLLAILQELDSGRIRSNLVALTPELVAAFQTYWQALVPPGSGWQPKLTYPFRYLQRDGFWTLVKRGEPVIIQTPHEPTLSQLAPSSDPALFNYWFCLPWDLIPGLGLVHDPLPSAPIIHHNATLGVQ